MSATVEGRLYCMKVNLIRCADVRYIYSLPGTSRMSNVAGIKNIKGQYTRFITKHGIEGGLDFLK